MGQTQESNMFIQPVLTQYSSESYVWYICNQFIHKLRLFTIFLQCRRGYRVKQETKHQFYWPR
jgi:hypothetical protein